MTMSNRANQHRNTGGIQRESYATYAFTPISYFLMPTSHIFMSWDEGYAPGFVQSGVRGDIGVIQERYPLERGRTFSRSFPEEVAKKAWDLLKEYMNEKQYAAFLSGKRIELVNKAGTHRIFVECNGEFSLYKGGKGEGFEVMSGRVYESSHPLGDEVATLLDWFVYKTEDLIANWNCGNLSIRNAEGRGMRRVK